MGAVNSVIVQATQFYGAGLYTQDGTIEWESEQVGENGAQVGICRFKTRLGAVLPFAPTKHMYVEMAEGATLRFTGRIRRCERENIPGVAQPQYTIECQDWMSEDGIGGIYVENDFTAAAGDNDKNIVTQLVALYWGQLATTGVTHVIYASHHNLPAIQITQGSMTLKDALDFIARLAGATYYIDAQKQLHWNDTQQLAAYVLDDTEKTGSYRGWFSLTHTRDATGTAFRVTVVGANGILATVTDEVGLGEYLSQRRYERGAPSERIPTLPDYTDQNLTSLTECRQEGWRILREQDEADTIEVGMRDQFVYPGQLVYLVDQRGLEVDDYADLEEEDLFGAGDPSRIGIALGLYLVRAVQPQPLGGGKYDFTAVLGAYRPTIERLQKAA